MKKLALLLFGLLVGTVVVAVAAVIIVPRVVDWRPRIVAAVQDATGRDFRIDGDLQVALLPRLHLYASGVRLANAPGAAAAEMLSLDSVVLDAEVWPLLRRRLVVNSLILTRPVINLDIDQDGRPNWMLAREPKKEAAHEAKAAAQGTGDLSVEIGKFILEQGALSYRNALTGQTVEAKDITLGAAMADLEKPLSLQGRMTLNDEPVTADLSVATPGKLRRGEQASVNLTFDAKHITAKFDGTAQQRPIAGLNGAFALDIPSVGQLAAWLHQPLAQADPGPLKLHATFKSEGAKSMLEEATLTGTAFNLKANGSVDASGDVTKITAAVESGVLDLDRYFATPSGKSAMPMAERHAAMHEAHRTEMPAGLSDKPFDFTRLRKLDADIKVSIAGVKAMGHAIGRIAFATLAKRGVLTSELAETSFDGGTVAGRMKLDGSADTLALEAAAKIDRVAIEKVVSQQGAAGGVFSATFDAIGEGKSPRALAEGMHGHLAADLGGVTMKAAGAPALSEAKLDFDLPGGDKAPSLAASAVYNGERVELTAGLAPLRQLLAGERFPAKLALNSKLVTMRYDGAVQQKPVPGLDGIFDADVPSVGKLAAWLGKPLDAKEPDPGPLKAHAALTSDGAKLTLKDASITGKAIKAIAEATVDAGQKPATFDVKIDVQQADLNAYLPPAEKAAPAKPAQASDWSTEPFGLAPLGAANGKARVTLAAVRYREIELSKGVVTLTLADRVLTIAAEQLTLAQGAIDSVAKLDATTDTAKLDYHATIAGVRARPLLQTFAGSDRLDGTVASDAEIIGRGRNQKELVSSLAGGGHFKVTDGAIYGINLAQTLRKAGTLGFGDTRTEKTDFAELSGSYTIKSGVIDNRDMKMLAPVLRLTGSGTVPMPSRTVDYTLEAKLVPTIEGQGGRDSLAGIPIPIKITGPWSNTSYAIDWASVFHEMAADPERLKNMPGELGKAAKEFGVSLPIPGGAGVGSSSVPGNIMKGIPGLQAPAPSGQQTPPSDQKKTPALPFDLPKGLLGK